MNKRQELRSTRRDDGNSQPSKKPNRHSANDLILKEDIEEILLQVRQATENRSEKLDAATLKLIQAKYLDSESANKTAESILRSLGIEPTTESI